MRVRVFHNNARDDQGRHEAWDLGYQPGHTVTEVFAYDVPAGEDPLNLDNIHALFTIGADPGWGKPDARALDYQARLNRPPCKGDVIAIEDRDLTRWWACARVGWDEIDPPTIDNQTDHGTTPIDATEETVAVRRVMSTSFVDQSEGMFDGQLRLVALAGYPISGDMWTLRDQTEQKLLDLARELDHAQAAWRLTRRGKQVARPDGEPGTEDYWETRAAALAVELVDAVATVKAATARTT